MIKTMNDCIERAMRIAAEAHEGQYRKEIRLPYISHPAMVALMLASYDFSETIIAAALTHDVLEDTNVTAEELRAAIGDEALGIVRAVTNDPSLPWEEKKLAYIKAVRNGPEGALAVAVADKVHNLESLLHAYNEQGAAVWQHFNADMDKKIWFEERMLATAKEVWDHPLVERYDMLLAELKLATAQSSS